MTTYTCPTCMQTLDRDLLLFIKHTHVHIYGTTFQGERLAGTFDQHLPLERRSVNVNYSIGAELLNSGRCDLRS